MSKMKHLLRRLHIGGSGGGGANDPLHNSPSASSSASTAASAPSSSASGLVKTDVTTQAELRRSDEPAADFNFFEEEFQVQLALAMSASDPDATQDEESAQIDAAKRISLGCSVPPADGGLMEFLSLRYWNYNVVNYDEKLVDGFYDVYGIISNSSIHQKLPSLVDLQAISVSDKVDYEVVLVDRAVDPALEQLERKAVSIAIECQNSLLSPIVSGLVQKIADIVVDRLGGPVGDAEEILRKWSGQSYELRSSLGTIVLPLGYLEVGLLRHRALLFKVLADSINLPCRLVKGSYYTGTDEGAINLIKVDQKSEYIVDLMGAPGTLIPAEMPSSYIPHPGLEVKCSSTISGTVKDLCLALDKKVNSKFVSSTGNMGEVSCDSDFVTKGCSSGVHQAPGDDMSFIERNRAAKFEHDLGKHTLQLGEPLHSDSLKKKVAASPAQKKKVKDVSKYVISAAQDPKFAEKLRAVLLESGASPPPDLFSDINPPQDLIDTNVEVRTGFLERNELDCLPIRVNGLPVQSDSTNADTANWTLVPDLADMTSPGHDDLIRARHESSGKINTYFNGKENSQRCQEAVGECIEIFVETANANPKYIGSTTLNDRINPLLNDVAEWEIPWENLQIGERIGFGSFGEVYRAEWNGTEVAVKKFLNQDVSGDALEQFRCEIKIMLRLRHPNVVLFMGAVTLPPNLSILTEFLPRGSLFRLLHRPNVQLDEKRRLRMALDVAKGMNYLHTSHPTIVHRDLKSSNLLVDKNWVVKVCDFGLSRLKHHTFLSSKSTAGTPEWMAPEVLRNEPSTEKCDVYSFGVILWELATLCMPWSGMNPMQVVGAVGFQNRRLDIPKEVDPTAAQIIRDCWQSDPDLRPSFAQLMVPLKNLKRLTVEDNSNDLSSTGGDEQQ